MGSHLRLARSIFAPLQHVKFQHTPEKDFMFQALARVGLQLLVLSEIQLTKIKPYCLTIGERSFYLWQLKRTTLLIDTSNPAEPAQNYASVLITARLSI